MTILFFAIRTTNKSRRRRLCIAAFTVFYFFSSNISAKFISYLWNYTSITVDDINEPCDIGLVLTGYAVMEPDIVNFNHFLHFNQNANRLTQSIELYKLGKVKRLMICGGSGQLIGEKISEGTKTYDFLLKMGVAKDDILIESKSRNTIENAQYAFEFLKEKGLDEDKKILLITTNFHMYRAKKCFDKIGLTVIPFCTGNQSKEVNIDLADIIPDPGAMQVWHKIIREWAAILVYRILGYI